MSASYARGITGREPFRYDTGLRGMSLGNVPTVMGGEMVHGPALPGSHYNLELNQDSSVVGSYGVKTLEDWPDAAKSLHEHTPVFVLREQDTGQRPVDAFNNVILSLGQANSFLRVMYSKLMDDFNYLRDQRAINPDNDLAYNQYDPREVNETLLSKRIQVTLDDRGNIGVAAFMSTRCIMDRLTFLGSQFTQINSTYPANRNISVITSGDANILDVFTPPANRYCYLWFVLKREKLPNGQYGAMQFHPISTRTRWVERRLRVYKDLAGYEQQGVVIGIGRVADREYGKADLGAVSMSCGFTGTLAEQNMAALSLKPLHVHLFHGALFTAQVFG